MNIKDEPFTVLKPSDRSKPFVQYATKEKPVAMGKKDRRGRVTYIPEKEVWRKFKPSDINIFGL